MFNLEMFDIDVEGFDLVCGEVWSWLMEYVLFNGFGFGGVNVSLLFWCWV